MEQLDHPLDQPGSQHVRSSPPDEMWSDFPVTSHSRYANGCSLRFDERRRVT